MRVHPIGVVRESEQPVQFEAIVQRVAVKVVSGQPQWLTASQTRTASDGVLEHLIAQATD